MKKNVLIINGPNLNMLGVRQPDIYGHETLKDIEALCVSQGVIFDIDIDFHQSNDEAKLIEWIQEAKEKHDGIIINAAAYTHTSIALLDALTLTDLPIIEVHLSNIHKREEFRHTSYISKIATGMICGLGSHGYTLAIEAINKLITNRKENI